MKVLAAAINLEGSYEEVRARFLDLLEETWGKKVYSNMLLAGEFDFDILEI